MISYHPTIIVFLPHKNLIGYIIVNIKQFIKSVYLTIICHYTVYRSGFKCVV